MGRDAAEAAATTAAAAARRVAVTPRGSTGRRWRRREEAHIGGGGGGVRSRAHIGGMAVAATAQGRYHPAGAARQIRRAVCAGRPGVHHRRAPVKASWCCLILKRDAPGRLRQRHVDGMQAHGTHLVYARCVGSVAASRAADADHPQARVCCDCSSARLCWKGTRTGAAKGVANGPRRRGSRISLLCACRKWHILYFGETHDGIPGIENSL